MTSVSLQSFGCRVNQAEAFDWAEEFQRRGFRLEPDAGRSDLVVVNTCTLTGRADRDVRKFLAKVGRENPGARLVVTGCFSDRAPAELAGIPNLILVANADKARLVGITLGPETGAAARPPVRFRSRGLLKVQDGCDSRCTFCVIPSVRGRSRSVPPREAGERMEKLARQGFNEVVLTGIHLNSYGRDLQPASSLLGLLRGMEGRIGRMRLRLSSLDPRGLGPELAEFLACSPFVQPHFHLSLQHGSDRVLARMGRKSTVDEYSRILDGLRRLAPEACLGADIMSGFPGESEEDFRATADLIRRSPLNYVHVFSYSARPGTAASAWPAIDPASVRRRTTLLRSLAAVKYIEFRRSFIGKTLDAVVIRTDGRRAELLTANDIKARTDDPGSLVPGDAARVVLEAVEERLARGRIAA